MKLGSKPTVYTSEERRPSDVYFPSMRVRRAGEKKERPELQARHAWDTSTVAGSYAKYDWVILYRTKFRNIRISARSPTASAGRHHDLFL